MKVDLVKMAKSLLEIDEHITHQNTNNLEISVFNQWWGNTSGGFEGIGGSAMTRQITYVLYNIKEAYVYFEGRFAYKTKMNAIFLEDLKNESIAGKMSYKKRYSEE